MDDGAWCFGLVYSFRNWRLGQALNLPYPAPVARFEVQVLGFCSLEFSTLALVPRPLHPPIASMTSGLGKPPTDE